jgi:hypothetical protein
MTGAPGGRGDHCAVWTGSEMIVWGGEWASGVFNDGGRMGWPCCGMARPMAQRVHRALLRLKLKRRFLPRSLMGRAIDYSRPLVVTMANG